MVLESFRVDPSIRLVVSLSGQWAEWERVSIGMGGLPASTAFASWLARTQVGHQRKETRRQMVDSKRRDTSSSAGGAVGGAESGRDLPVVAPGKQTLVQRRAPHAPAPHDGSSIAHVGAAVARAGATPGPDGVVRSRASTGIVDGLFGHRGAGGAASNGMAPHLAGDASGDRERVALGATVASGATDSRAGEHPPLPAAALDTVEQPASSPR
jgi:hypothetical protein